MPVNLLHKPNTCARSIAMKPRIVQWRHRLLASADCQFLNLQYECCGRQSHIALDVPIQFRGAHTAHRSLFERFQHLCGVTSSSCRLLNLLTCRRLRAQNMHHHIRE